MSEMQLLIFSSLILGVTFVVSIVLTWCSREIAVRRGITAPPRSARHVHVGAIPRLGGIPLFVAVLISAFIVSVLSRKMNFHPVLTARFLGAFVIPATVAFAAGLYDDIAGLRPSLKLLLQCGAGALMFAFGLRIVDAHFFLGTFDIGFSFSAIATVFWVALICNAINLIDGLDGLAAGSSVLSLISIIFVASLNGRPHIVIAATVLSGALLGFLRFNFNPASIFLGDSGSLYLGVMLSGLSMAAAGSSPDPVWEIAVLVIGFGLPVIETVISVMRRLLSKSSIFTADREHIHHRLLDLGLSHRNVVLLLYGISGMCAILSCLLHHAGYGIVLFVGTVTVLGAFVGIRKLGYPEFKEVARLLSRTAEQRCVIANDVAVRKTAMQLNASKNVDEVWQILVAGLSGVGFDALELDLKIPLRSELNNTLDGDLVTYYWAWEGQNWIPSHENTWELSLRLSDGHHSDEDTLRMFRQCRADRLPLDINILVRELQPALRNALSKIFPEYQHSQTDGELVLSQMMNRTKRLPARRSAASKVDKPVVFPPPVVN